MDRGLGVCLLLCSASDCMKRKFRMPSMSRTYIAGVVFAASVFLLSVVSAFGESYSVSVIKYSQSESFYGIDAAGNFVVNVSDTLGYGSGCAGNEGASQCFATYYVGQQDPVL